MLWFERKLVWRHRKVSGHYRAQGTWPWSLRLVRHIYSSNRHQTGSTHEGSPTSDVEQDAEWARGAARCRQVHPLHGAGRLQRDSSLSHSRISTGKHRWEHNGFNHHPSPPTALLVLWKYLKKQMANNLADTKVVLRLSSNATFENKETKMKEICKWSLISSPICLQCIHSFALVLSTNVLQYSSKLMPHN